MTSPGIARREFLGGAVGAMAAIAAAGCATMTASGGTSKGQEGTMFAYVGCYTTKQRNGHGEGISVYRMDRASGDWTQVQLLRDIVNPSFLALDRQQRFLYSAHGDGEQATAFAIDKQTGALKLVNQQAICKRLYIGRPRVGVVAAPSLQPSHIAGGEP